MNSGFDLLTGRRWLHKAVAIALATATGFFNGQGRRAPYSIVAQALAYDFSVFPNCAVGLASSWPASTWTTKRQRACAQAGRQARLLKMETGSAASLKRSWRIAIPIEVLWRNVVLAPNWPNLLILSPSDPALGLRFLIVRVGQRIPAT